MLKIFIEENIKAMPSEEFYGLKFDGVLGFESEEEEGIGFTILDEVFVPVKEENGSMDYVLVSQHELREHLMINYSSALVGKVKYLGSKADDYDFSKNKKITVKHRKDLTVSFNRDEEINYYGIKENEKYFIINNIITVVRQYDVNGFSVFTEEELSELPKGVTKVYETYKSTKKTKGITDVMKDPYSWLKY